MVKGVADIEQRKENLAAFYPLKKSIGARLYVAKAVYAYAFCLFGQRKR